MAQDVGIVETLLTLCTPSTCADGISKRTRVKVNKDGTQTLAASCKVSLKEYTYIEDIQEGQLECEHLLYKGHHLHWQQHRNRQLEHEYLGS